MTKAILTVGAVTVLVAGVVASAQARVDVHIGVGIPLPPAVVFEREPEVILVPST